MRWFLLSILVFAVSSQVASSQNTNSKTASLNKSEQRASSGRGSGRSISNSPETLNDVPMSTYEDIDDDEDGNVDSAFDNSHGIVFPDSDSDLDLPLPENIKEKEGPKKPVLPKVSTNKWQKIPLKVLVELGNEGDITTFLRKHVKNAIVVRDNNTNDEILADTSGAPLLNSKNETVVVTPAHQTHTFVLHGISPHRGRPNDKPQSRMGPSPPLSRTVITTRLSNQPQHKASAPPVFCTPELKSVPVPNTVEPHILQLPKCLRVERCGGCCLTDLTVCEPDKKEMVKFPVKYFAYVGEQDGDKKSWEFVDEQVVQVERHTSCKCQCRTKAEDCKPNQNYVEELCSCMCKNQKDFRRCEEDPLKRWDKDLCACFCREIRECSSGFYYDLSSCSCKEEIETGNFGRRKRNTRK